MITVCFHCNGAIGRRTLRCDTCGAFEGRSAKVEPFTMHAGEWGVRFPDRSVNTGPWNSRGAALAGGKTEWHRREARS